MGGGVISITDRKIDKLKMPISSKLPLKKINTDQIQHNLTQFFKKTSKINIYYGKICSQKRERLGHAIILITA